MKDLRGNEMSNKLHYNNNANKTYFDNTHLSAHDVY